MNANRIFFIVFGMALLTTAIYVWIQPFWVLPTRSGETRIHFIGLAHFLFGLSAFLCSLSMFRNAAMPEIRKEPIVVALFGGGIISMILSFLLSQKL